jgi:hypothetical protein
MAHHRERGKVIVGNALSFAFPSPLSVATRTLCVTARNGARIERVFQRNKHQRRLQRCRTNENGLGDFGEITRA